jgi:hypothetical protein
LLRSSMGNLSSVNSTISPAPPLTASLLNPESVPQLLPSCLVVTIATTS